MDRMKQIERNENEGLKKIKVMALSNCQNLSKIYCSKNQDKRVCQCDTSKQVPENEFVKSCRETLMDKKKSYIDVMKEYGMEDLELTEEELKKIVGNVNICGLKIQKKKSRFSLPFIKSRLGGKRKRKRTKKRRRRRKKRKRTKKKRRRRRSKTRR